MQLSSFQISFSLKPFLSYVKKKKIQSCLYNFLYLTECVSTFAFYFQDLYSRIRTNKKAFSLSDVLGQLKARIKTDYIFVEVDIFKSLPESAVWNAVIAYKLTFLFVFVELRCTGWAVKRVIRASFVIRLSHAFMFRIHDVAVISYMQDLGAISFLYCTLQGLRMHNLLFRIGCTVCS